MSSIAAEWDLNRRKVSYDLLWSLRILFSIGWLGFSFGFVPGNALWHVRNMSTAVLLTIGSFSIDDGNGNDNDNALN